LFTNLLKKLQSEYGEWIEDDYVYHVSEPHLLTQAAGYLKFVLASDGPVFYRGQTRLYPTLYPSLYRQIESTAGKNNLLRELVYYMKDAEANSVFLNGTPTYAYEPIFQHYGIKTRWLDLVDNIWVALWFACHHVYVTGRYNEYLHFKRRKVKTKTTNQYAYIILMKTGNLTPIKNKPGLYSSKECKMIDLRIAAPSLYLRPHAQHGILIRNKQNDDYLSEDYTPLIVGVLRVNLEDALSWLGEGEMLSVHTLFPPPHFDFGYRNLLEKIADGHKHLGKINHIGA
jgi:hypothetical protein